MSLPYVQYVFPGNDSRPGATATVPTEGHTGDMEGALRYIVDALPGEPVFVIRGRDALAYPVLSEYVDQCYSHGLNGQGGRASKHLERFQDWQRASAKLTHLPDPLPE